MIEGNYRVTARLIAQARRSKFVGKRLGHSQSLAFQGCGEAVQLSSAALQGAPVRGRVFYKCAHDF